MTISPGDKRFVLLAIFVALLSAAAGFRLWQLRQSGPAAMMESLMVLPEPRNLADFSLVDQHGAPFSLERLRGQWSLLFFGFTHCPDVCPSALYDLHRATKSVAGSGDSTTPPQVVFVSVDPERDTPERLGEYVTYFDQDFVGVTGSGEQLAALTLQIGIAYRIEPHDPGATAYSVDHSASVMLTDPDGRLYGVFPAPHNGEAMARDLLSVMN